MKHLLSILLAIALFATANAKAYKYESVKGDPMQVRIYTLDNGLKVYLSVNKDKPRIYTNIAVHTGSRNDPAETTGLAHYFEHIMFKGTKQFGTTDYAKEKPFLDAIRDKYEHYRTLTDSTARRQCYHEIDSLSQLAAQYNIPNEYDKLCGMIGAANTNAYTSTDQTVYENEIPSNELEKWLKIESDRFQNCIIRGFHTELESVYEEYNMGIAKDSRKMWQALYRKLFPNHPYGTQTTIGTQEHLKNPSICNIENYYHTYYCPNNVAIIMSGDINPDETIALIDKHFGSWKRNDGMKRPEFPTRTAITQPTDSTIIGQEAAFMVMAWQAKGGSSLQLDTLSFIDYLLCNGVAGLIDLNVNQAMACASAASFVADNEDYSAFCLRGQPKEGQTNEEVRRILLNEIARLKKGDFDESLLKSIINNFKKSAYEAAEQNEARVGYMTDAFIYGKKWTDVVNRIDRISKITKKALVSFANGFFRDNYVIIYKEVGTDSTLRKIDKPAITAIPANREYQSQFLADIANEKSADIKPIFPDYAKSVSKAKTKSGLNVRYVKNTVNKLFTLIYKYEMGKQAQPFMDYLSSYLELIGTKKYSAEEIQTKFYSLACSYSLSVDDTETLVELSGLSENMEEAMALYEHIVANAKADYEKYTLMIDLREKMLKDMKSNQQSCFSALNEYGQYGKNSEFYRMKPIKELRATKPETILATAKLLKTHSHIVLYYGPMELKQVVAAIDKHHKVAKRLISDANAKHILCENTPKDEVYLAPYDAKNIIMVMYNCEGRKYDAAKLPLESLFNAYYGGGMNAIVFQELRETRGLAYSAFANYAYPHYRDQKEKFYTYISSQNDKMLDCISTFKQIIDTIPQNQKAFDIAKESLLKNIATERTIKINLLTSQLTAERLGLGKPLSQHIYEGVQNLTLQDLVDFANTHIAHKPFRYIILGNEQELDIKALERIAPIRRLTLEEVFNF